jgi:hypothetical protein
MYYVAVLKNKLEMWSIARYKERHTMMTLKKDCQYIKIMQLNKLIAEL